jgi:hypothetical protein
MPDGLRPAWVTPQLDAELVQALVALAAPAKDFDDCDEVELPDGKLTLSHGYYVSIPGWPEL